MIDYFSEAKKPCNKVFKKKKKKKNGMSLNFICKSRQVSENFWQYSVCKSH